MSTYTPEELKTRAVCIKQMLRVVMSAEGEAKDPAEKVAWLSMQATLYREIAAASGLELHDWAPAHNGPAKAVDVSVVGDGLKHWQSTKAQVEEVRQPREVHSGAPTEPAILYLGDMRRLALEPNDVLVVTAPGPVSNATEKRIQEYIGSACPGHQTIVLAEGMLLGVIASRPQSSIEAKLDTLIAAIAGEDEDPDGQDITSLDGQAHKIEPSGSKSL